MVFLIAVIFDQIVKYIVEKNQFNFELINNVISVKYVKNTRWYIWRVKWL